MPRSEAQFNELFVLLCESDEMLFYILDLFTYCSPISLFDPEDLFQELP